jgi:hypothetical protein
MSRDAFLHPDPDTTTDSGVRPRPSRFSPPGCPTNLINFAYTSKFTRKIAYFSRPFTSWKRCRQVNLRVTGSGNTKTEGTNPRLSTLSFSNIITKISMIQTIRSEHPANISFSHVSKNRTKFDKNPGKFTSSRAFFAEPSIEPEPITLPRPLPAAFRAAIGAPDVVIVHPDHLCHEVPRHFLTPLVQQPVAVVLV